MAMKSMNEAAKLASLIARKREIIDTLPIMVFVVNLETDDVIDQIEMDYAKFEDKKELGRLTYWALTTGHYLELMSKKDIDLPYVKE